jgi:hypothetical protein
VARVSGSALILVALLASFAWWRARTVPQFGGDWVRYLSLDKDEPVARYVCVQSERGLLIVIREQIRIVSNPYLNSETDEPVSNQEACRIEYGLQEGWKFGSGSDGSGLGYRSVSLSFLGRRGFLWSSKGLGGADHMVAWERSSTSVSFPLWILVIPGSAAFFIWVVRAIKRYTLRGEGGCATCGYDMRATPVRCPECGSVAGDAAAAG